MKERVKLLISNGLVVMKTDTLYGILGCAFSKDLVERIYSLKNRDDDKPFVILISSLAELSLFGISLTREQKQQCIQLWQEKPTSIIFDIPDTTFQYLHRGKESLAFRIPQNPDLKKLLVETGPLVAPSANPQGLAPAQSIEQAQTYFGNKIDLYVDGGICNQTQASRIVVLKNNNQFDIVRN